jgi:hypothetical protein
MKLWLEGHSGDDTLDMEDGADLLYTKATESATEDANRKDITFLFLLSGDFQSTVSTRYQDTLLLTIFFQPGTEDENYLKRQMADPHLVRSR